MTNQSKATQTAGTPVAPVAPTSAPVESNVAINICDFVGITPAQAFMLFTKVSDMDDMKARFNDDSTFEDVKNNALALLTELNINIDFITLMAKIEEHGIAFLESIAVFIGTIAGATHADTFRTNAMRVIVTYKMTRQAKSFEESLLQAIDTIDAYGFKGNTITRAYHEKQAQCQVAEVAISAVAANEEVALKRSAVESIFTF